MTSPVTVHGGSGGIEARCDDLSAAALFYGRAATAATDIAVRLHGYLVHPAVVAAAPFDPVGAADFEWALLSAVDGPGGVTLSAVRCGTLGLALRGAVLRYLGADRLAEAVAPLTDALRRLPGADADFVGTLLRTHDPSAAAQRALTADPALVDLGVGLAAAPLGPGSVQAAAALLGRLYPDGRPRVQALGIDAIADAPGPPRSLADVVAGLSRRNDGRHGEVDVRILGSGSGARHVVVDVPGTKDWSPAPQNRDITSLATNLRALAGVSTSYERGVLEAMRTAGVRSNDEVMLVGHSEGGMVVVNAATHLAGSREFHVSHVVTAGAPVGAATARVPSGVQVLAMENDGDLVPHLDDVENPDRVNVTTVELHRNRGAVGEDHSLDDSYLPGAADVDASADRSIRAFLDGSRGFFTGTSVRTHTFQITREQ